MTMYLSRILGKPVWDEQGERLGRCVDLLAAEVETGFPYLRAIAVRDGQETRLIAAQAVAWLSPSIILNTSHPPTYQPRGDELWLARQVLDRQIVDTEGRRLVRANDVQITRVSTNGVRYHLAGVDVGTLGLLRRLGVEGLAQALFRLLRRQPSKAIIPWRDVASLQADKPIRLRVSLEKISEFHPADIADIIEDLDRPTGQALLQTLDTEIIADTIEEIEPELQVSILGTLPPEQAADVLEEMGPDVAADLLADLQPTQRAELLELMEAEDATDVQKLLTFPEDSAGGIMTTEFATIPMGLTVGKALEHLRESRAAHEDEALFYVYVLDENRRLQGVIALRELVLASPDVAVRDVMQTGVVTVDPLASQRDVARLVAKYNLLAVPVVDDAETMQGVVTVDDAIDAIIPTAWKKRLPRVF
ncbi:MAG: magnesium transporter [Anaerolineales bacterium]|nr:MAG: magnesium transporter [Anaerolineales bacterium]